MSKRQISKLEWFGNDADGLTVIDLISAIMFFYFLVIKSIQLSLAIRYSANPEVLDAWNTTMNEINNFTELVMMFYFGKKVIDTATTKIGLFKSGKYEERNLIETPDEPVEATSSTTGEPVEQYIEESVEGSSEPLVDLIMEPESETATISPSMIFGARKSAESIQPNEPLSDPPIDSVVEDRPNVIKIALQKQ